MSRHPNLLDRQDTVLIVVDVQESFRKAIPVIDLITSNVVKLVESAKALDVPVVVTTQNRARLGDTLPEIANALPEGEPIDKMIFSCCGVEEFTAALAKLERKTPLVCGIETHVCISQTVHDLLARGYKVHVPADAVASRTKFNWEFGLEKMRRSGAIVTTTEAAILELLEDASRPEFKRILQLVK